jgi:predicted nucleic acid-binding protein
VTTVVLDASVIVKWVFADRDDESHSFQALHILQAINESRIRVFQPPHWLAEVAAVITRLDFRRARQAVSLLYTLELPILMDVEVYQKACDLSETLKQHVFDTLYHAVALHEPGAFLVTADERYYRAAHRIGQIIKLKDFDVVAF